MHTCSIPPKARLDRTLKLARQFIKDHGICALPVDPFKIYEEFEWALFSCKEIEDLKGKNNLLLLKIRKEKADAITFRDQETNIYITVFDENKIPERIRWTLAHEIAHIILCHLTDFNETCMNRGGLSVQQYRVLEREANIFSAELLSPMALLILLEATQSNQITSYCQISKDAADHREREIKSYWELTLYSKSIVFFENQFKDYLRSMNKVVSLEVKSSMIGLGNMDKHMYIPVDNNNRFTICPRCGNDEFSKIAKYCKLCGLYLFNACTNAYYEEDSYCNHVNNGDARYCEVCGAPTVLYKLGLLKSWEELIKDSTKSPLVQNQELNPKAKNTFCLVKGTTRK